MGAAQAAVIHAEITRIHGEVTHWQAAHPGAGDPMVNAMEFSLRCAADAARLIHENRRTWPHKEDQ
jgi:hypothetical protein